MSASARLTVEEGGLRRTYGTGRLQDTLTVRSPRTWPSLLRGSRGLADAYAAGWWDSSDLVALIRVAARNVHKLDRLRRWLLPVRRPVQAALAPVRANTRRGAAGTSPRTTTSATTCSRGCSTGR